MPKIQIPSKFLLMLITTKMYTLHKANKDAVSAKAVFLLLGWLLAKSRA